MEPRCPSGRPTPSPSSRCRHRSGGGTVNSRTPRTTTDTLIVASIAGEVLDDWSWAVRTVRGSTTVISNHASGTAVDLNATRHARGVTGTFTRKQVAAIRRILADLRVIRWGGDFTTVADEMHAEINGSLAEVAEAAERIIAARAQEDDMQLTDRFVLGPTTATLIGKPSVTVAEALSDILGLTKDTNRDVDVAKQALTAAAQRITALQTDVDALRAEVAALKAGS